MEGKEEIDVKKFSSIEEECKYYRDLAKLYRKEKQDVQKEFEIFTDESRQLEHELEATLIQNEKQIRDAQQLVGTLREENETLRQRLQTHEREATAYETKLNQLFAERDSMKKYIRELEQKNDDLERANRNISETVETFKQSLHNAIEEKAILEGEVCEKDELKEKLQRMMDEARDLKQELTIRSTSSSTTKAQAEHEQPSFRAATSMPAETDDHHNDSTLNASVNAQNDYNDSMNNNSDISSSALAGDFSLFSNDSSVVTRRSTTRLSTAANIINNNNNGGEPVRNAANSSDNTLNRSSKSVLKYDCAIANSNPIAASTRVSALNIVADLLKKLDNLEAKLKSWKTQKSPSQRFIEASASYNNNENSCSIENLDRK